MTPFFRILCILLLGKVVESKTLLFQARGNKLCPDKQGSCPETATCCQLESGKYGCCPLPNAVCCSDREHCCPQNTVCDLEHQMCTPSNGKSIPWSSKVEATPVKQNLAPVLCPDQTSHCPSGQTCCKLSSGLYGCCPLPQAVCCDDFEHCCPNGYTCDVPDQTCNKGNGEKISWSQKVEASMISRRSNSVVCPDHQSQCEDGQTCCQLESGSWGCCPLPQAVCCEDHEHCCPNGETCDVAHERCLSHDKVSSSWLKKISASPINKEKSNSVICPDKESQCGDGDTCCQLPDGQWGCCPLPQAVCCSDHLHCCPNGKTCDVEHEQCLDGEESTPWFSKSKANPVKKVNKNGGMMCPDQSSCDDGQTCCLLGSGDYGCCPLPKATCCSDLLHCCPNGYKCDLEKETCVREDGLEISWSTKYPSKPAKQSLCSDKKSQCRAGSTCCSNKGNHACCPFENGVCCSDGLHCCPADTTCDAKLQMCQSNTMHMAVSWNMLEKLIGSSYNTITKSDTLCPDQKSECPTDSTCCQMQSGLYGCCPFSQAICCEDKLHCCPSGTKCDPKDYSCVSETSGVQLPWEMFGHRRAKTVL